MVMIFEILGIVFNIGHTRCLINHDEHFICFLSSLTQYSARYVVRSLFVSMWDKQSLCVNLLTVTSSLIIYLICLPEVRFSRHCSLREQIKYRSKTSRISSNSLASCRRRFLKVVLIPLQVLICGVICILFNKPLHQ